MTLKMSRATISRYGNTRTHGRVRMCVCAQTNIQIHRPSGLQQPARCVIRLANQAEAEGCLPFISRCVRVCVCVLICFSSAASLALLWLRLFIALSVPRCLHQHAERTTNAKSAQNYWLQTKYSEIRENMTCKFFWTRFFLGIKITLISSLQSFFVH